MIEVREIVVQYNLQTDAKWGKGKKCTVARCGYEWLLYLIVLVQQASRHLGAKQASIH